MIVFQDIIYIYIFFGPTIFLHNLTPTLWLTSENSPRCSHHSAKEYVLMLNESVTEIDLPGDWLSGKKFGEEGTKAKPPQNRWGSQQNLYTAGQVLAAALKDHKQVTLINLADNDIADGGAKAWEVLVEFLCVFCFRLAEF